mgnify:CR=1 FL=1
MATAVETLSKLERRMTLSFPLADVQAEVEKRLKVRARTAKAPGFRPGKVPMKMVAAQFGYQVETEVLNDKVGRAFNDAAVENNLRVAGFPRIEPKTSEEAGEGKLAFDATFEVYPEVTLGDLSGAEVEKTTATVSDAEIDKTIDILRKQRTRFNHAERAAQAGDRVTIDFKGTIDGEAFAGGSADNYSFVLGEGQMLPEFETGVTGMSEGETKDVPLNFPEDYHGKDVAGKQAVFAITLKNVAEPQLPEVDADFAKNLGVTDGDVAKMRDEISKNVTREAKRRLQARVKEGVMQALLDVTPIELPKSLIDMEIGRLMQQAREDMMQRGYGAQMKDMPLPRELFEEQAKRRVSLGLILAEVVEKHSLSATPEQVKAFITEQAESYENPQEVIDWYYASPERLDGPASVVLEDNVVAFVLSQAKVNEQAVPFEELMGNN